MIFNIQRNKCGYFLLLSLLCSSMTSATTWDNGYEIDPFPNMDVYIPQSHEDTLVLNIAGRVIIPACSVDTIALSENYVKQVNLGVYTKSTIESDRAAHVAVPFNIYCNRSYSGNISLFYSSDHIISGYDNVIQADDNSSIAIELTKGGDGDEKQNLVLGQKYELINSGGYYDGSFNARVVKSPNASSVLSGAFRAGLTIGIRYN
ncbi:fimbrial protein [Vibrio nomapromontoriensis]|uniref:fimbrial protein n=1 Tax=Vibrio nomapromontoriensis TaxID=2910246 RepID=UPI003D0E604B